MARRLTRRTVRGALWRLLAAALPAGQALAGDASRPDLTTLPFEQLLDSEVWSASRFAQRSQDAPSSVTVLTADDIRTYGWRTLGDALRSVRGLYAGYDRAYTRLGARGFMRPGDSNTRFLLLIDGARTNDPLYDQASVGGEFPLDLALVERIEYVPGAGSSVYGSNAFFGVINVITKSGAALRGVQGALSAGSAGERAARASIGWTGASGTELLLAADGYRRRGTDLYFPEFDGLNGSGGIARGLDGARERRVYARVRAGGWTASALHAERDKAIPTAPYQQSFNDPRSRVSDRQDLADLRFETRLGPQTDLLARVYAGAGRFDGSYAYRLTVIDIAEGGGDVDPGSNGIKADNGIRGGGNAVYRTLDATNFDMGRSRWYGAELKAVSSAIAGHKLVAGLEFQRDARLDLDNYDLEPSQATYLRESHRARRAGAYVQDEVALRADLLLNAGLRYDRHTDGGGIWSPRAALIWAAGPRTALKAVYGSAYRAPDNYELYYNQTGYAGHMANPDLRAERTRALELTADHTLESGGRVSASLYRNRVTNLIAVRTLPELMTRKYDNIGSADAHGAELEYDRAWRGGVRLRASYAWQSASDDGMDEAPLVTPRHLAKANLSVPLRAGWRLGAESRYTGRRATMAGSVGGYWLSNVTLSGPFLAPGVELSASVYNLLDRRYADPSDQNHVPPAIAQDGRTFRLTLRYGY